MGPVKSMDPVVQPLNEFEKNDEGLCTCFPSVFLFGRAYKQEPGKLTYEQRFHLLNQFTCHAAQDWCLIGYLHDVQQRFQTIYDACAHVKSNQKAAEIFSKLCDNSEKRAH